MRFEDRQDGEYRIHAGSLEPRAGEGHLASVIVNHSRDGKIGVQEIYRDLEVSGHHRWLTSDQALHHALMLGAKAVVAERQRALSQTGRSALDATAVDPLFARNQADLHRPPLVQDAERV